MAISKIIKSRYEGGLLIDYRGAIASAVFLLKGFHKIHQGLNAFHGGGVVDGGPAAAHGTMPLEPAHVLWQWPRR